MSFQPARSAGRVRRWPISRAFVAAGSGDAAGVRRRRLRAGALVDHELPTASWSRRSPRRLAHARAPHRAAPRAPRRRSDDDVFAALNTAYLRDGALIVVPRDDQQCPAPVHLLFVATQKDAASYPRCLVVAEAGSAVHGDRGLRRACTTDAYFTNAVTEIASGEGARVRPRAGAARERPARSISPTAPCRSRSDAAIESVSRSRSARGSRATNLNVLQHGEGAEVHDRRARADRRAPARRHAHAASTTRTPHGTQPAAAQVHRRRRRARGVQRQDPGAPGRAATDSAQQSRNLLLTRQGARRHQAAARDLRRRREVRARRDRRPARPRAAVLPAEPRAVRSGGAQSADLRVRRRGHRPHPGRRRSCERLEHTVLDADQTRASAMNAPQTAFEARAAAPVSTSSASAPTSRSSSSKVDGKPLVYLDNAASSQMPQPVIDRLVRYQTTRARQHPPRGALPVGDRDRRIRGRARARSQRFINAREDREVIFTSGTTDAINLVTHGYGRKFIGRGRRDHPHHARAPLEHRAVADAGGGEGREAPRGAGQRRAASC